MKSKVQIAKKDIKLLYYVAIISLFSLLTTIFFLMLPKRELFWQDYASYNYDATIETDENGEEYLSVDISTPEQLAGIFSDHEKTYNLYITTSTQSNKKI